jgi:hypothetical protein
VASSPDPKLATNLSKRRSIGGDQGEVNDDDEEEDQEKDSSDLIKIYKQPNTLKGGTLKDY